jgi:thymidylate synthase
MQQFEQDYAELIAEVLVNGEDRDTRNGETRSVFGKSLIVQVGPNKFPLLQGRKMHYKGVLGELAALLRRPKCVKDFTKWGCNYWDKWADKDGMLILDYGNAWFDFNGYDQIAALKDALANNPTDRRMIINSWRPDRLSDLSLPCCHYSYQFYVEAGGTLNMIWTQRSVDMMIGLPSDIVLGATMLIIVAKEFGYTPGFVKFDLGDCHIYKEHMEGAVQYVSRIDKLCPPVYYEYEPPSPADFCKFEPGDLIIKQYDPEASIKFLLKE